MAKPVRLPDAFSGMVQDLPRDRLPKGKAWNMVDWIPNLLGAPLVERGGWSYASPDINTVDVGVGANTPMIAVAYAPFSAGNQLVAIDNNSHVINVASSVSATDKGAAVKPKQAPVFLNNLLVIPSPDGTAAPFKYDGSAAPSSLSATAPSGQYAAVYGSRCWLANTAANPTRVYGSSAVDPTTWDKVNGWVDVALPITGLAALPNVLLVFSQESTARFRGSTPPPQTDISLDDPVFQYGCTDANSIAVNGSYASFANPAGVFLTNGTAFPTDLTSACGISNYWRKLLTSYDPASWNIACGWFGRYLFVSVRGGGSPGQDCIVMDPRTSNAYRISNLFATNFASTVKKTGQELYAAWSSHPRILSLSSMFVSDTATANTDADGTNVLAVLETPFYEDKGAASQRWRDLYLEYDMRDSGTSSQLQVLYVMSPEAVSYFGTSGSNPMATTGKAFHRNPLRKTSRGIGIKLNRFAAATDARVYALYATVYSREGSRLN